MDYRHERRLITLRTCRGETLALLMRLHGSIDNFFSPDEAYAVVEDLILMLDEESQSTTPDYTSIIRGRTKADRPDLEDYHIPGLHKYFVNGEELKQTEYFQALGVVAQAISNFHTHQMQP